MVNKLKEILSQIESERGAVSLFALFKMDDVVEKWTILLGASWINDDNSMEVFNILRTKMIQSFTSEERSSIARMGIYNSSSHLIKELSHYKTGVSITERTRINGNIIHEGIVIKSEEFSNLSA